MPILVEADTTTAGVLTTALPAGSQVVARADEVDSWLNGRGDYALVIGPTLDMRTAGSVWPTGSVPVHPATTVVLIRHELEPEVFAQAMQVGHRGRRGRRRPRRRSAPRSAGRRNTWEAIHGPTGSDGADRNGRVFTVFSPKGGVGKTTMAVNLGLALAATGVPRSAWSTSTSPSVTSRSPCS